MLKDTTMLEDLAIKNYIKNYEKNTIDIKNKSINYLMNNDEKDFSDINYILKRMEYNQMVFPKKIQKENTLREIRRASLSL